MVTLTPYLCSCTELATKWVTRPPSSSLILPPIWCTKLQSVLTSFLSNPVKQMIWLDIVEQNRGRELYGSGWLFLAHPSSMGGPMIRCSSLYKVMKSSPLNGSQTNIVSLSSVIFFKHSLTSSVVITFSFKV